MNNKTTDQSRIDSFYRKPQDSIYCHRFFTDLCSCNYEILEKINEKDRFYTFDHKDSNVAKLFLNRYYYNFSYEIEQVIGQIVYSLISYGKAYAYIEPDYSKDDKDETLSSLALYEIEGFVKKRINSKIEFCYKKIDGTVGKKELKDKQLIEFDIRDLGFNKTYFVNILKKLNKCDITSTSTNMLINNVDDYDSLVHSKKSKLQELKITKDIGWSFGSEGLSDSYILYRKILEMKLKTRFSRYILDRINSGIDEFLDGADGKLVANYKSLDYDHLWLDYIEGKITSSELSKLLYAF